MLLGNFKLKQWDITIRMPKSRTLTTPAAADKDVENRNFHLLLLGMQNGIDALEDACKFFNKTKCTLWASIARSLDSISGFGNYDPASLKVGQKKQTKKPKGTLTTCAQSLSYVQRFATHWAVAHQAPLSTGYFRQEYQSGWPFPPPGDTSNPGIEALSSAL